LPCVFGIEQIREIERRRWLSLKIYSTRSMRIKTCAFVTAPMIVADLFESIFCDSIQFDRGSDK